MEHLIELRDVYKIYPMGSEQVHALDGISLTIDRGVSDLHYSGNILKKPERTLKDS